RLPNGRERRLAKQRGLDVVEARDGDILRDVNACAADRRHEADGHAIVAAYHGIGPVFGGEEHLGRSFSRLERKVALDPCSREEVRRLKSCTETSVAFHFMEIPGGAADVTDTLPTRCDELVRQAL